MRDRIIIMESEQIRRTTRRMSMELMEKVGNSASVAFLGVNEGGFALAGDISSYIKSFAHREIPVFSFDIESGKLDSSFGQAHFNVLVLMDDVIFSGKTMFNAIQGLDLAGVDSIFVSVLIDRGHRSMPVLAEFVGKQIPTKLNEHVHVELLENNLHQVYITNQ